MDENNSEQIVIKKKSKGHHGHHGGAWKVAYADFVTAMMALFIVLWILTQSDKVKQAISGYFNDPAGFGLGQGPSLIEGKTNFPPPKTDPNKVEKDVETERLIKMGGDILNKLRDQTEFEDLLNQIEIQIVDEGLRIEIMESNDDVFFESGSAVLNKKADHLLRVIGKQLSYLSNKIIIEGHTDSRPYLSGGESYTNWELSADRANSARRSLINAGVKNEQIDAIKGYADHRLRDQDNPFDIINRRISIIVKYSENI